MPASLPLVSTVLACRNEARHIDTAIRRILSQEGIGVFFDLELLVIDGESEDRTRELAALALGTAPNAQILRNPNRTTPFAFNTGITHARGEFICILGSHAEIAPNYISACLAAIQTIPADVVGGPWVASGKGYFGQAIAQAFQSAFAVGGARSHAVDYEGLVDGVWGGFYRREIFDRIGLFDTELTRNQDDEWYLRLAAAGGMVWQTPMIRYRYFCRSTLRGLAGQYFQYGYWKPRILAKHRRHASVRHFIPPLAVSLGAVLVGLGPFFGWARAVLFGLSAAYFLAATTAAVYSCIRAHSWRILPAMPLVFFTFHAAYGFGYLFGVFALMRAWRQRPANSLMRTRAVPQPEPHFSNRDEPSLYSERRRIQAVYSHRETAIEGRRYSPFNPGHLQVLQEIEAGILSILNAHDPQRGWLDTRVLEVGCGRGHLLRQFVQWGWKPERLTGVDILRERLLQAREASQPGIGLASATAEQLPFPNSAFDIVVQSTVLSSILESQIRRAVCAEMLRVCSPGGLIIWHDFRVNNPLNPDTVGIPARELRELFPGCTILLEPLHPIPPLTRILARHLPVLSRLLGSIPLLCTHYLGAIHVQK